MLTTNPPRHKFVIHRRLANIQRPPTTQYTGLMDNPSRHLPAITRPPALAPSASLNGAFAVRAGVMREVFESGLRRGDGDGWVSWQRMGARARAAGWGHL